MREIIFAMILRQLEPRKSRSKVVIRCARLEGGGFKGRMGGSKHLGTLNSIAFVLNPSL